MGSLTQTESSGVSVCRGGGHFSRPRRRGDIGEVRAIFTFSMVYQGDLWDIARKLNSVAPRQLSIEK